MRNILFLLIVFMRVNVHLFESFTLNDDLLIVNDLELSNATANSSSAFSSQENLVFKPRFVDGSDENLEIDYELENSNLTSAESTEAMKNLEAIFDFVQFFLQETSPTENTVESANAESFYQLKNSMLGQKKSLSKNKYLQILIDLFFKLYLKKL